MKSNTCEDARSTEARYILSLHLFLLEVTEPATHWLRLWETPVLEVAEWPGQSSGVGSDLDLSSHQFFSSSWNLQLIYFIWFHNNPPQPRQAQSMNGWKHSTIYPPLRWKLYKIYHLENALWIPGQDQDLVRVSSQQQQWSNVSRRRSGLWRSSCRSSLGNLSLYPSIRWLNMIKASQLWHQPQLWEYRYIPPPLDKYILFIHFYIAWDISLWAIHSDA